MIKIICDRCGKELSLRQKIGYIAINFKNSFDGDLLNDNYYEGMHFCMDCIKEIQKFVMAENPKGPDTYSEKSSESEGIEKQEAEEQKEGGQNRKRIDYGKIMALRNAGWDNARIADEMHMTKAAVATAISTYKKKHL